MTVNQTHQSIPINTADGQTLNGSWYPSIGSEKLCIVAPAMATSRHFYHDFSMFLCESGFNVVSFDYAGRDAYPRSQNSRGFRSVGELDLAAVIEYATARSSAVYLMGHSLGINALGFAPNNHQIVRAISIASGSGYYGWMPVPTRWIRYGLWRWFMPTMAKLFGYFPGKKLGLLDDLPGPLAIEWSRMCCTPGYVRATSAAAPSKFFLGFRGEMLVVSFTDDHVMLPGPIDDLHENFANARITRKHIDPKTLGIQRIGHMGTFKPTAQPLWHHFIHWLNNSTLQTPL